MNSLFSFGWPWRVAPFALLAAVAAAGISPRAAAVSPEFAADCKALTGGTHRLTGSTECQAAADHIAKRLRDVGVDAVIVEPFPTVSLKLQRCELVVDGRSLPLLPVRPDGIIPPVTPASGIASQLLVAGRGDAEGFGDRSPAGKIVVLNYNSEAAWLRAFRLGAKAVIFVADGAAESWQAHCTDANANLPRYYYPGPAADLVDGASVTIHCQESWIPATGRNVIGFIRGTDPKMPLQQEEQKNGSKAAAVDQSQVPEQALILAANLDTFGEVPHLAPGARGAANCAALLHLASELKQHPPRRNVVLAFFDGQAYGHAGVAAFYRAIERDQTQLEPQNRKAALDREGQFVDSALSAIKTPEALQLDSSVVRELLRRLKFRADEHFFQIKAIMEDVRKETVALRHVKEGDAGWDGVLRLHAQMDTNQQAKDIWNDLRRCLAQGDITAAVRPPLADCLRQVMDEVRADLTVRQVELAAIGEGQKADEALAKLLGEMWLSLHVSLLLGDSSEQWGVFIGGDSVLHANSDQPGLYGKIQKTFNDAAASLALPHFSKATVDGTLSSRLFWPTALVHSGEIAGRVGIYNLAVGTVQEPLAREGTPDDTLAALNLDRIETQVAELGQLLAAAASQDGLSLRRSIVPEKVYWIPEWKSSGSVQGPTVMGMTLGSSMPNKPMTGAVVQVRVRPLTSYGYQARKIPAFNNFLTLMTDANASYSFGPVVQDPYYTQMTGFAAKFEAGGAAVSVSDLSSMRGVTTRLNLFPCVARTYVGGRELVVDRSGAVVLPPQVDLTETTVLQAISNGALDPGKSFFATVDGVIYWYCEKRVEAVKLFGADSMIALGMDEAGAELPDGQKGKASYGRGLSMLVPWEAPESALRAASDLWPLNELRLATLRNCGVLNSSIEELHGRAEELLAAAKSTGQVATKEALAASSYLVGRPVYKNVRTSLDDLVRAVLILLALALPFAFALERLLIGSTNIYRQIGWFIGFFAVTFFLLYLVHPAFAVSNQPVIIFLAFALMVLSALVIGVIMQKFQYELKVIQGLTSTVHTADVSRFSTMMAAMSMGISTMRRRPLRTALTALTITLLTFTILNFASFDTRTGIVTLYEGSTPKYTGVFLHKVNWAGLDNSVLDILYGRWGAAATVVPRYWLPAGTEPVGEATGPLITRADGTQPLALRGVLGLDPREFNQRADIRSLLGADGKALDDGVFMTGTLARQIGVAAGDAVVVGGVRLKVAALLDAAAVGRVQDMDENSILPVDFAAMTSSQGGQALAQQAVGADLLAAMQNKQDWVPLPIDSVVIVSTQTAQRLGASLRVVTLYTANAQAAVAIAEDAARMLPLPVAATRADGVYTHVLAPTLMAKGLKDLLFPILLGGLVIFGTMLGSVADREKEIYTFSALGLAPAHVATLFFAEALVYSCVGGLGGYLLAQGVQRLLSLLVDLGLLASVPEMNYSSVNAIVTILIVMGTVLVSAIYPAFKASRSANPGILRTWRLPAPDQDRFHIVFPFTVSAYDITGVVSFLKEHFDNFSDTSLGVFMARDTQLVREADALGIRSILALAPFDLGVTETFMLRSAPSEIAGIDEVKIEIERLSGQNKDWARLNKVLLGDLRRQFLIWRSLPQETMELYRQRTLVALGDSGPERNARGGATAPAPATA